MELVISSMRKRRVDVYAMQETWLEGSSVLSNKGHSIILRNDEGADMCEPAASSRVLAVRLEFTDMKEKMVGVCAIVGYRPLSSAPATEHEAFDSALDEAEQFAKETDVVLMALDGNGSVGVGDKDDPALGPYGLRYRNEAGADLLSHMKTMEMVEAMGQDVDFAKLDGVLKEVAEETLAAGRRRQPGWFTAAESAIVAACAKRNLAFKRCDAWDAMKALEKGMDESRPPASVPLRVPRDDGGDSGKRTVTSSDRLKVLVSHFEKVFNRKSTFDPSVLELLEQRPIVAEIGADPTREEVVKLFRRAASGKACGLSGVHAELYKAALDDVSMQDRVF
eukprot:g4300.t1